MIKLLVGWNEIASVVPFSSETVRRKYGPEMRQEGYVLKTHLGRGKRLTCWSWESLVKVYFVRRLSQEFD